MIDYTNIIGINEKVKAVFKWITDFENSLDYESTMINDVLNAYLESGLSNEFLYRESYKGEIFVRIGIDYIYSLDMEFNADGELYKYTYTDAENYFKPYGSLKGLFDNIYKMF